LHSPPSTAVAIIDERAGTRIAQRDGIAVHGTLWLVANGLRSQRLARPDAERIVDELIATDMVLPVDSAGFVAWAYEEGLLP
jgi:predicted nucleic acid-binding protein